jgi:hypothetical protein
LEVLPFEEERAGAITFVSSVVSALLGDKSRDGA